MAQHRRKTSISFLVFPNGSRVGEGKCGTFPLSTPGPVFATITGKVLEVTIPRTQKSASSTNSTVRVRVQNRLVNPTELIQIQVQRRTRQLACSILFTDYAGQELLQFWEVQRYQLIWPIILIIRNNYRVITPITLPPDTTYQKNCLYWAWSRPESVCQMLMAMGSQLSYWTRQNKVIHAKAVVELSVNPQPEHITVVPNQSDIQPENYWQSDNPQIQSLAAEYQNTQRYLQRGGDWFTRLHPQSPHQWSSSFGRQMRAWATQNAVWSGNLLTFLWRWLEPMTFPPGGRATGYCVHQSARTSPVGA